MDMMTQPTGARNLTGLTSSPAVAPPLLDVPQPAPCPDLLDAPLSQAAVRHLSPAELERVKVRTRVTADAFAKSQMFDALIDTNTVNFWRCAEVGVKHALLREVDVHDRDADDRQHQVLMYVFMNQLTARAIDLVVRS